MNPEENTPPPAERRLALLYGILCHALFAAGVGVMAVSLYSGMQTGFGPLTGAPAWLVNAHQALDQAVANAYGWNDYTPDMTDKVILQRLLKLNLSC